MNLAGRAAAIDLELERAAANTALAAQIISVEQWVEVMVSLYQDQGGPV